MNLNNTGWKRIRISTYSSKKIYIWNKSKLNTNKLNSFVTLWKINLYQLRTNSHKPKPSKHTLNLYKPNLPEQPMSLMIKRDKISNRKIKYKHLLSIIIISKNKINNSSIRFLLWKVKSTNHQMFLFQHRNNYKQEDKFKIYIKKLLSWSLLWGMKNVSHQSIWLKLNITKIK